MPRSRIVAYLACSLDGYIAAPDGGVAWLDAYAEGTSDFGAFMSTIGVLAMGRTTFEHSRKLGPMPKMDADAFVLTHSALFATYEELRKRLSPAAEGGASVGAGG